MNFTALVAVLEIKGIISREEGERLVEFLNNKPQSTLLADAVSQVKEFVDKELPQVIDSVKQVAKEEAKKVAASAKPEAGSILPSATSKTAPAKKA